MLFLNWNTILHAATHIPVFPSTFHLIPLSFPFFLSRHISRFLYRALPQPRTPRCRAAARASTAWPQRLMAARWVVTAAPCLEEEEQEEQEEGGGTALSPTETQS